MYGLVLTLKKERKVGSYYYSDVERQLPSVIMNAPYRNENSERHQTVSYGLLTTLRVREMKTEPKKKKTHNKDRQEREIRPHKDDEIKVGVSRDVETSCYGRTILDFVTSLLGMRKWKPLTLRPLDAFQR